MSDEQEGVTLYEALTSQLPYHGSTYEVMVEKQRHLPAAPQQISLSGSGTSSSPGISSNSCRGCLKICCACRR